MSTNWEEPPKKIPASGIWMILGITVGSTLLGVAILGSFGAMYYFGGEKLIVSMDDRALLTTATEFEGRVENFLVRNDAEEFGKRRTVDGVVELKYEYTHPDPDVWVWLINTVAVCEDAGQAAKQWLSRDEAMRKQISEGAEVVRFEPKDEFFNFGDASSFAAIVGHDDVTLGYCFSGRSGRHIVTCAYIAPEYGNHLDAAIFFETASAGAMTLEP